MRKRLVTLLSIVSLLLCVGFVALWVRSYAVEDAVHIYGGGGLAFVRSFAGSILCVVDYRGWSLPHDVIWMTQPDPLPAGSTYLTSLRTFVLARLAQSGWIVTVPHWAMVLAFAAFPLARFLTQRVRRRAAVPAFPVSTPDPSTPTVIAD